jgi:hypothetical protein
MSGSYLFSLGLAVWLIFALPLALWTLIWEIRVAWSVRDVETPGLADRVRRFTTTAKIGGPAVLAVLVGTGVNFGTTWISSGDESDARNGILVIFVSVVVAMFGGAGIARLIYAGGYTPGSLSALRADMQEPSLEDLDQSHVENWKTSLERLDRRIAVSSFEIGSEKITDSTQLAVALGSASDSLARRPTVRRFLRLASEARSDERELTRAFRAEFPWRFRTKRWFFWGTVALSALVIPALFAIGWAPEGSLLLGGVVIAQLTVGFLISKYYWRAFTIASVRRSIIFQEQKSQCQELLISAQEFVEAKLVSAERETTDRRGLVRRMWSFIW